MVSPRITVISSYEDLDAIRAFVRSSLALRPDVEEMLAESDPTRLVVVKPNWIQASHEFRPDVWEPVITHPAVLLSIIEVLGEMMAGRGTIALCDAPNTYADFPAIARRGDLDRKLDGLRARWPDLNLELIDLRREVWLREEEVVVERRKNPEDPRGYARLDLGRDSLFYGYRGEGRYYGADYDARARVVVDDSGGVSAGRERVVAEAGLRVDQGDGIEGLQALCSDAQGSKLELADHGAVLGPPDHPGVAYLAADVIDMAQHGAQREGACQGIRVGVVVRQNEAPVGTRESGAQLLDAFLGVDGLLLVDRLRGAQRVSQWLRRRTPNPVPPFGW